MRLELASARSAAEAEEAASRAADVLAAGGLIIHPTETVYGIGGDGSAENNVVISRVKLREAGQPLLLLTPDLDTLRECFTAVEWPAGAETLADHFWPGPLTVVVRCPGATEGLIGPGGGLAVRVSPDPVVTAILRCWRRPMTSTSANFSGCSPARTLEQALQVFDGRSDLDDVERTVLAIDAGTTKGTTPSTIISFVESRPQLLREGLLSSEQLEPWLGGSSKI